jgi:SAM-dependent methyltransferase
MATETREATAGADRHDGWHAGDGYEAYMGRWSRKVAPLFLDWISVPSGCDWLEVGCGTGALSAAVLTEGKPRSLIAIDPSQAFIATARSRLPDRRAEFRVGHAEALPVEDGTCDVVVSALVLNFVPDRTKSLAEMRRVARSRATVAFYVWDYPSGGMEMMRAFWSTAAALDPSAAELSEDRRFPFCTADSLTHLAREADLRGIVVRAIEVSTQFQNFDDFWLPFTLGTGPAPGYCMALAPEARQRLKDTLRLRLTADAGGRICLNARAWSLKAVAP